jgi:hypothetical protein
MEAAKKTYHLACKEEKMAATREANGKTEASVTQDQQKKLHEKTDKCKHDTQKVTPFGVVVLFCFLSSMEGVCFFLLGN